MYRYLVIAICLCAPVHSAFADLSWYLGAGGTYTTLETKDFSSGSGLGGSIPANDSISTGEFKDSPFGFQVYGGLNFSEYFGFALKYFDTGEAKDQWAGVYSVTVSPGLPPVTTDTDLTFDGDMSINGVTLYFVQTVPMSPKVDFALELGFTAQDLDFNWRDTSASGLIPASSKIATDDTGFAIGALGRYKIVKNIAITGELEWTTVDFGGLIDRPLRLSLNAEIHF